MPAALVGLGGGAAVGLGGGAVVGLGGGAVAGLGGGRGRSSRDYVYLGALRFAQIHLNALDEHKRGFR